MPRPEFRECGIFAYGFARARCDACGHDFLVAFSCKGRGVCPSCNTRRMVEMAAHLSDHIFPKLPVRQWVLSLPKRLRYFLQHDPNALNTALRRFLRLILASLHAHCHSAVALDRSLVQLAARAFIHRFGSSLRVDNAPMCIFIFVSSMACLRRWVLMTVTMAAK
jgi:hypothetical protein